MSALGLIFIVVINLLISWFNAKSTGKIWLESKAVGGWVRLMAWCGAIISAVGFTYCYSIIITMGLLMTNTISEQIAQYVFNLTYLLVVVPIIGAGLIVTINSWIMFARERSLKNLGVASWNTFAQAFNMYNALDGVPSAFSSISDLFDFDGDSDNAKSMIVIAIVLFAVVGGIATTMYIMQKEYGQLGVSQEIRDSHQPIR